MNFEIKLPIPAGHGADIICPGDIGPLASYVDHLEDRYVTHKLFTTLALKANGHSLSLQGVADSLQAADPAQRRQLLDRLRQDAGLSSLEDERHEAWQRTRIPDTRAEELVVMPGGAIISHLDIEAGTAREQARATNTATLRAAQAAEAAVALEEHRQYQQAIAKPTRA